MSDALPSHFQQLIDRLGKVAAALDESLTNSEVRVREQLDARAKLMAYAVERVRSEDQGVEVLGFSLGAQRCAIPTRFVIEMFPTPAVTRLPGAEPHILGVCNVRGQLLLVIDLMRLFGFAEGHKDSIEQILILGAERAEFGVICRGEGQTLRLPKSTLSRSAELAAPPLLRCADAVTSDGLLLLDGKELLRDPRLFVNQTG